MNPLIIKIGGILLDSTEALHNLFNAISKYRYKNKRSLILIHGGGFLIDNLMQKLSIPIKKINGLRITPEDHITIVTGALETVNKILLSWAKKFKINQSLGLCIGDGDISNVNYKNNKIGHVGNIVSKKSNLLKILIKNNYLPIINSIGINCDGNVINVNSDQVAASIAESLNADLIFLTDVSCVFDGKGNRINEITNKKYNKLISQGIITNGMIIKVKAAIKASKILKKPVEICSWYKSDKLLNIFKGKSYGTRVFFE
ncbi:MAG: acetylglutamate kinase [Candidatus Makana argininalis]